VTIGAGVIQADLREPDKILADPETQLLIDFTQPVALLLLAVLHFVPDAANPAQILATLRDAVSPGSYLVICHACRDVRPGTADNATAVYNSRVAANLRVRTRDEIAALFDGFTLVEQGLVWIPEWRPGSPDDVPETRSNSGLSSAWPGATPDSPRVAVSRGGPPG
jgi:hypothetical protein